MRHACTDVRAPADVAEDGVDRQLRELGSQTALDAEQVVFGVIDQRQRRRLAGRELTRQLRSDAAAGAGDQQPPVLERAAIDRPSARSPPAARAAAPRAGAIQLDHDCSSRITMSTRRLRARFSAESFGDARMKLSVASRRQAAGIEASRLDRGTRSPRSPAPSTAPSSNGTARCGSARCRCALRCGSDGRTACTWRRRAR